MAKRVAASRRVAVKVLYFAVLRELAGCAGEALRLPARLSERDLRAVLQKNHPRLSAHLPSCRLAVNGEFVSGRLVLKAGDELAVLPPVAGG